MLCPRCRSQLLGSGRCVQCSFSLAGCGLPHPASPPPQAPEIEVDRIENFLLDFEQWRVGPEDGYNPFEAFASEFMGFREQLLACLDFALEKESQCSDLLTHQALLRAHLETGLRNVENALDLLAHGLHGAGGDLEAAYNTLRLGGDHLAEALRMVDQHCSSSGWLRLAA